MKSKKSNLIKDKSQERNLKWINIKIREINHNNKVFLKLIVIEISKLKIIIR